MASKIWRNLIRTAAAACFVVGSSAQAGGVFYQSDFDPVNFMVKAIFNVDYLSGSKCRASDGFVFANALDGFNIPGRQCDVSLYSAVGTLTTATDPSLYTPQNTAYLPFLKPPADPLTDLILGVYIEDGELAGILWDWTVLLGPITTNGYVGTNADLNGTWKLSFASTDISGPPFDSTAYLWELEVEQERVRKCVTTLLGRVCWYEFVNEYEYEKAYSAKLIYQRSPIGYRPLEGQPGDIGADGEAIFRSADVPEPGSLALLGGALVAGWITRRRKAAA